MTFVGIFTCSQDENEDSHATETYNDQSNAADVQNVVLTMTNSYIFLFIM